ncbi:hypothetical protein N7520_009563 [Penicillium odoratum]|uniref:uncharacterized protein n=1 Tax=Penicillium odoratum TaxID=1167516 RepID=UPI002548F538|nr:uncharacterized protein N7520_009563 [Penicillium odoratum]KAJ5752646.1 hypothetical protein N7520_009563 [Penicillium odoratum]
MCSFLKHDTNISNTKILYVDYDRGSIGTSIRNAYAQLQGNDFPSIVERPASEFLDTPDLEVAICRRFYHAAIFTSLGASDRLDSALMASSDPTTFNQSDILIYVWNKHLYPGILDSIIEESIQTLNRATRAAFFRDLDPGNWAMISRNPTTIPIVTNPWVFTPKNGYYNSEHSFTVGAIILVFVILVQGSIILEAAHTTFTRLALRRSTTPLLPIGLPILISAVWTLFGSLFTISVFFAFCPNWSIDWYQFLQFWVVLWIFSHVNFMVCDALPLFFPYSGKSRIWTVWMLLNIASASLLLDFPSSFSNLAKGIPAYQASKVLIDIWAPACEFQSFVEISFLFSIEVLCLMFHIFRSTKSRKVL